MCHCVLRITTHLMLHMKLSRYDMFDLSHMTVGGRSQSQGSLHFPHQSNADGSTFRDGIGLSSSQDYLTLYCHMEHGLNFRGNNLSLKLIPRLSSKQFWTFGLWNPGYK